MSVGANWVRFGEIGFGGTLGMRKLGSFRVIGGWQDGGGAEIGFVSCNTPRQIPGALPTGRDKL